LENDSGLLTLGSFLEERIQFFLGQKLGRLNLPPNFDAAGKFRAR
jgi:hypothetical protein